MYPHRIRLRGPWTLEALDRPDAAPLRATLPGRWADGGLVGYAGTVRYRRSFGLPRRLDDFERLWLTCERVVDEAEVLLNGERLGTWRGGPSELEATGKLRPRNELVVAVRAATPEGGLTGEVALEIRRAAWLADIATTAIGDRLRATGRVVGRIPRGLELYVVAGRSTAIYAPVPEGVGWTFDLTSEALAGPSGRVAVRIELVVGAEVWYGLDGEVTFGSEPLS